MKRRAVFVLLVSVSAAGMLMAQKIKLVHPTPTSAADGKAMFTNYCASCHGADAKGEGPAAPALKVAPADLTRLAARHNGIFPAPEVSRYIRGADGVPAHGTRDMPVWGDVFKVMQSPNDTAMIEIRVNVLTEYLKSLQAR